MSTTEIVLVGIGFVFAMLLLITGILYLLPGIAGAFSNISLKRSGRIKSSKDETAGPEENDLKQNDLIDAEEESEEELIAVITAAIENYNAQNGNTGKFRVVSLKRAGSAKNGMRR